MHLSQYLEAIPEQAILRWNTFYIYEKKKGRIPMGYYLNRKENTQGKYEGNWDYGIEA